MKLNRFLFYTSSVLIFSEAVWAKNFTVQQLIEMGTVNSKQITASDLDAKARQQEAEQSGRWDNPSLDLGSEQKDESGGSTKFWRVGLSQTFGVPGRTSVRKEVGLAETRIAELEHENTTLFLKHEIFRRVYSYRVAEEMALHAEERLKRFKDVQSYLSSRTFASPQKHTEVGIVNGKLLVLEREILKLKTERDIQWENLNLYLGLKIRPQIKADWYIQGTTFSLEEILKKIDKNPELKKQNLLSVRAEKQLELSRKEAWPHLTLSGSYMDGSGFAPERIYGLGVAVPLPVFNANGSGIEANRLRQKAESTRLSFGQEKAEAQIRAAFLKFEAAKSAIQALSVKRIQDIEKNMMGSDQGFRKGQVDLLTYIEADSQHSESLDAIYGAQIGYVMNLSELLSLLGDDSIPLEK